MSYTGFTDEDRKLLLQIQANKSITNNAPTTQDDRATRSISYASGKNSIRQNTARANELGSQALQIEPRKVEGGMGGNKSRYSSGINQNPPPKTEPPVNKNPPPKTDVPGKKDTWKFDPAGKMKSNWAAKSPEQKAAGALNAVGSALNTLDMLTGGQDKINWMSNDLSIGANWDPNMFIDEV